MTEKFFRNNPDYRDKLKALLEDEPLKSALQIIADRSKPPRLLPTMRAGVPLDTTMSHELHKRWGIQHAVDRLLLLAEPYKEEEEDEEEDPFLHGLPPEMQKALKKQREQNQQSHA